MLEWLGTFAWLALVPVSLRSCYRAWRRDDAVDAGLVTMAHIFAHICAPFVIVLLAREATLDVVRSRGVLSASEASELVAASEAHALTFGGWATARHASYPTTDVAVESLPVYDKFEAIVEDRVYPLLSKYGVRPDELALRDLFVVKYDIDGQKSLVKHRDGCELSFGVALTPSDGQTTFATFDHSLRDVHVGELWAHPSQALHRAKEVTEPRYVLVGFVRVTGSRHMWRTWGGWSTALREWRDGHLHFESPRYLSLVTLAKRRVRSLFRVEDSTAHTVLRHAAVFLVVALLVVLASCVVDLLHVLFYDAKHEDPPVRRSPKNDDARGRYADDVTLHRRRPSTLLAAVVVTS